MKRRGVALTAVMFLALAGCGGREPSEGPSAPTSVLATAVSKVVGNKCPADAAHGTAISFDTEGKRTAGITMGTGDMTVVLIHELTDDVCQWLPYGRKLTTLGYRVLVFEMPGHGVSEGTVGFDMPRSVVNAVSYARANGSKKIVLIGATTGATAAAVAAKTITPPIDGFVALSATAGYRELDGVAAMQGLLVPAEFFVAAEASNRDYTAAMYDAMPKLGVYHGLTTVPGTGFGVALLEASSYQDKTVADDIERFLTDITAGNL